MLIASHTGLEKIAVDFLTSSGRILSIPVDFWSLLYYIILLITFSSSVAAESGASVWSLILHDFSTICLHSDHWRSQLEHFPQNWFYHFKKEQNHFAKSCFYLLKKDLITFQNVYLETILFSVIFWMYFMHFFSQRHTFLSLTLIFERRVFPEKIL